MTTPTAEDRSLLTGIAALRAEPGKAAELHGGELHNRRLQRIG
ncbi:hypothetical protein DFQ14_10978 [Halopolyspora algeriensis]|uniref:Uncharacterized protein n=1 Tax=Halopolyspora algeriensis TaxID=1500506 RepID=A0A368VIG7_9ACTN|nr:hypothetical protein [Halopolyspora algeriensis]RCW41001.1 hypothetical protein DFQ14_10978 [Halopolyspora algeriensis]TQM53915.1 hypothetical protein FHU43_2090 [Halopolyspora algeriensis]